MQVSLSYSFNKTQALVNQDEDINKYTVTVSVCGMTSASTGSCVEDDNQNNVIHSITHIDYVRQSTLELLMTKWQWFVAIAAGIIVFIIIFVIFKKCDLFNAVRVNKKELDDAKLMSGGGDDGEDRMYMNEMEIDGENIEMR